MKKIWGIAMAFVLVGVLIGYGIGAYTMEAEKEVVTEYVTTQSTDTYTTPADLEFEFDDAVFDVSGDVEADGGTDADGAEVTHTLTITNEDDTRTANDVYIAFTNPLNDKRALDEDLEEDETTLKLIDGSLEKIVYDGEDDEYANMYLIGDLNPGDVYKLDISFILEEDASEDTYEDGESYDCDIFIYQPDANDVDSLEFTVET